MKVLLLNPPDGHRHLERSMMGGLGFGIGKGTVLPPTDLCVLDSILKSQGIESDVIDARFVKTDSLLNMIEEGTYTHVVSSVSLPTLRDDVNFINEIKTRFRGGVFVKSYISHDETLNRIVSGCKPSGIIVGEPDFKIAEILNGGAGSVVVKCVQSDDLDSLPFANRKALRSNIYSYEPLGQDVATYQSSRGCPYSCSYYCPYPLVEGKKWRAQSASRIFAELKHIVTDDGITKVLFRDATFTLRKDRVIELCSLISENSLKLDWWCETRADLLDAETLFWMKQAGLKGVNIGVESGDERLVNTLAKKGLKMGHLRHIREKAGELGIRVHFLLQIGLPGETKESVVDTADLILNLSPDSVGFTFTTPFPGTPLYEEARKKGLLLNEDPAGFDSHTPVYTNGIMTADDMKNAMRYLYKCHELDIRRKDMETMEISSALKQNYSGMLRWAYGIEKKDEPVVFADKRKQVKPALSVVIPTRNRADKLMNALGVFNAITMPLEIIIVSDGSTDETVVRLKEFDSPHSIVAIQILHSGPARARNEALRYATGDVVLFTGDDIVPTEQMIARHAMFHAQNSDEKLVCLGYIKYADTVYKNDFIQYLENTCTDQFAYHLLASGEEADYRFFYSSNISIKRSFLEKFRFNESFKHAVWEDIELGYRMSRCGMKVIYDSKAIAYHDHEVTLDDFMRRTYLSGKYAYHVKTLHPEISVIPSIYSIVKTFRYRRLDEKEMLRFAAECPQKEIRYFAYKWLLEYTFNRGFYEEAVRCGLFDIVDNPYIPARIRNFVSDYADIKKGIARAVKKITCKDTPSVVLYGSNQLAEMVFVACRTNGIEVRAVVDGTDKVQKEYLGSSVPLITGDRLKSLEYDLLISFKKEIPTDVRGCAVRVEGLFDESALVALCGGNSNGKGLSH